MGIFDDAIREHLELKRHAGADEDELKELEDEAFGQAARPGEPDFPGTSEEDAVEAGTEQPEGVFPGTEQPEGVFDAETVEAQTPSDAVIEAPSEEQPALTAIEEGSGPGADETPPGPASEAPAQTEPQVSEETEQPGEDVEPTGAEEPARADPAEASSFSTEEREAIADQPTVFFEQQAPAEMELGDLELDIDEEIEEVGGAVSEPATEDEPLIVEEAFSEPAADTEVAEPPQEAEPEPATAEPEGSDADPEDAEPATGDDDVLEETPEFLRDNPDDDELWFEQGEPKDFDF